jgi:hypothetical protein
VVPDIAGETLSPKSLARLARIKTDTLPQVRGNPRLGACVGKVGNFLAIGLNYADHAAEPRRMVPQLALSKRPHPVSRWHTNENPACYIAAAWAVAGQRDIVDFRQRRHGNCAAIADGLDLTDGDNQRRLYLS